MSCQSVRHSNKAESCALKRSRFQTTTKVYLALEGNRGRSLSGGWPGQDGSLVDMDAQLSRYFSFFRVVSTALGASDIEGNAP